MTQEALSHYSKFMKFTLIFGVGFFFAMGAMSIWLALADAPSPTAVAILVAMSIGFGAVGAFGLRLFPFINSACAATPEGLHVFDRNFQERFYEWRRISHYRDWPALQVLDIYDLDGNRVLSVDYLISNFQPLYRQVQESVRASASS